MKKLLIHTFRLALLMLVVIGSSVIFSGCASESKNYNRGYSQPAPAPQPYQSASRDPKAF